MIDGEYMKILFSQKGVTIIETVVALGLLGLGSYFLTGVLRNGSMGQKALLAQDDARILMENISAILADPIACENTFGGIAASPNPNQVDPTRDDPITGKSASVNNIVDVFMKPQFTVGNTYGRSVKLLEINIGGTGVDTYSKMPKWVVGSPPTSGVAFLQIIWQQSGTKANLSGPQNLNRYLMIHVTKLDAGNHIVSCSAQSAGGGGASYWSLSSTGFDIYNNNGGLGNIGIQTTTPRAALDVEGSGGVILNSGNVGIGTILPATTLDVHGGIRPGTAKTTDPCSAEGALGYDAVKHSPVYCGTTGSSPLTWMAFGSGAGLGALDCTVVSGLVTTKVPSTAKCPTVAIRTGGGCSTIAPGSPIIAISSAPLGKLGWACDHGGEGAIQAYAICCE